jgi:hypothetical protein
MHEKMGYRKQPFEAIVHPPPSVVQFGHVQRHSFSFCHFELRAAQVRRALCKKLALPEPSSERSQGSPARPGEILLIKEVLQQQSVQVTTGGHQPVARFLSVLDIARQFVL